MTETKTAPENGLYAALAKLQAKMPAVAKNRTGTIPGKDGKKGYSYDYADLADVTAALLPLMGSLGLAFTSRPTVNAAGQFVLAYKLVHVSGEADEGEYLLPSPERVSPQQLGSFITYARRYSLCCVTGLAPGGDDDDAQSAQQVAQNAWENATPARAQGQQPREEARAPEHSADADDGNWGDWRDVIDGITSQEDADKADADLREVFKAAQMGPAKANAIRAAIKAKAANLSNGKDAEPEQDMVAQRFGGEATAVADTTALRRVHQDAMKAGKLQSYISLDNGYAGTLLSYITGRKAELEMAASGQAAGK